ncbi:MAG: sugar ABC transporter substrate-binding protein [Chloroflexi bacterium]|mgnify:CR=1 FL=1|jgi:multiple sugar transport system substrate-binding protein|nr:sugar ABC transporter substrate-binding protein [Chloroflexota bacterium]
MKSRWTLLISVLMVLSMVLAACAQAPATEAVEPPAAPETEAVEEPTEVMEEPTEAAPETEAPAETEEAEEPAETEETAASGCPIEVEEGATITFSGWGDTTEQQIYRDSIARFNEVCPEVTVDYVPVPDQFQDKMKAQMAAGTAPDVFYVDDQLMTAFAPSGQLLDLTPYMEEAGVSRDDFIPQLFTIFATDDAVYALPKDWGTLGLIYLPQAFEDAGVEPPTEDWTWEDMRAAANQIAQAGNYAGFCMGADWARFAPFVFSNGGSFVSDDLTTATLNTPEVTEMATFVAEMYEEGSLVTPADVGASWCGEAIGRELVAMTTEGGWMVNTMNLDYPDVEWDSVLIPAGPVTRADVIFTNGIGVSAATQYPRAAAAFTLFVTGEENQAAIVETGFAYSTHPSQADLIINDKDARIAAGGSLPDSRVAYWGPNTGRINDIVSQALSRVFLGDQTVEESFNQANQEAQALLDSGG